MDPPDALVATGQVWGRNDGYARGEFDMGAMVRGESAGRAHSYLRN